MTVSLRLRPKPHQIQLRANRQLLFAAALVHSISVMMASVSSSFTDLPILHQKRSMAPSIPYVKILMSDSNQSITAYKNCIITSYMNKLLLLELVRPAEIGKSHTSPLPSRTGPHFVTCLAKSASRFALAHPKERGTGHNIEGVVKVRAALARTCALTCDNINHVCMLLLWVTAPFQSLIEDKKRHRKSSGSCLVNVVGYEPTTFSP